MNPGELAAVLEKYLRTETFPLGIKMFTSAEELPEKVRIPSKHLATRIAICQGVSIARRYGWTVAMGREDVACPVAKAVFGFEEMLDFFTGGKLAVGMYTDNEEAGKRFEEVVEKFDFGEYSHMVVGPLSRLSFEPDTVLVYGNSAQVLRLLNASLFKRGGSLTCDFSGRGDCSDIAIKGKKKDQPQVILPCYGDRVFGMTGDHEMAFTFPFRMADEIAEGLEKTHKMGVRYPIPQYLRFEPQFPATYQELEKMWEERRGG